VERGCPLLLLVVLLVSLLVVVSALSLPPVLPGATPMKRKIELEGHDDDGDDDSNGNSNGHSNLGPRRRHRRPSSNVWVDPAVATATTFAAAAATEGAEADEDAMDRALPLPGSTMEACATNM
jgi:hypothetical protein